VYALPLPRDIATHDRLLVEASHAFSLSFNESGIESIPLMLFRVFIDMTFQPLSNSMDSDSQGVGRYTQPCCDILPIFYLVALLSLVVLEKECTVIG